MIGRITGDGNPFDAWGNGDYAVNLPHAMSIVDRSERIGAVVYCADTSNEGHVGHPGRILENVKMLAEAAKTSHKPYYLISSRPGVMNTQQAKAMREAGLVQIGGTRQGLGAIDRIARYMTPPRPLRTPTGGSGAQLADVLAARAGRRTSTSTNFETAPERVRRAGDAAATRRDPRRGDTRRPRIGYPVVLKAVSDDIPHKTELGLVAVGLASDEDLARAFQRLSERLDRLEPRPSDAAFLVQEFVADGVEVFAGVSRDPADFGLTLAFGMGGIAIEITRDFALRALPLREGDVEAMIAETRGAAMLGSIRGRPAADVKSLAACLNALGDFAHHNADVLEEIDLDPIKALPDGRGCVVVDALIVAQSPARG